MLAMCEFTQKIFNTQDMSVNEYDHLFKFVLIGDTGVGKSCMIFRFCDDTYTESYIATIGVDFKIRYIDVPKYKKTVKLQLWDSCSRQTFSYRNSNTTSYRGAHAVIVLFDVTDQASFDNVKKWLQEIDRYACENVNKILVGCKCDLIPKTVVNFPTARDFGDENGLKYFECSSKYCINLDDIFSELALDVYERVVEPVTQEHQSTLDVKIKRKEKGCARKIQ